jgi:serine/threonine protein kinase
MAEPRTDPPNRARRRATPTPVPQTAEEVLFDEGAPSTDESPTIISRNHPRLAEDPGAGIRGRRLAHFELIEAIGVGGMAAVLRARDTQLDRCVALKILPPELAVDPDNVQRFHQEARSAAKLDHENIARVFFCGEDQRLHFIAFEFVDGENLRNLLERRGRLPVAEALTYMIQVAAGLCHAVERGVVHRDIKPSNIIITPNGRAKLVDMGLARSLEPRTDRDLTQSGVTLGTFDYISPEQALEPRDADVRSDIYSLGCTFYHCLTGRPPVPEGTAAKKLHHHQHVKPVDPRQLVPGLPDEVALVLDRMMAKDPRARYQTPAELVQHLLQVARKVGAAPELPDSVLSVETSLPNPPGARPLLLAACAGAILVGALLLFDQTTSPPSAHHPTKPKNDSTARTTLDKNDRTDFKTPQTDSRPVKDSRPIPKPTSHAFELTGTKGYEDLLKFAQSVPPDAQVTITIGRDLDLPAADRPDRALRITAASVKIEAAKGAVRPTIRLVYNESVPSQEMLVALAIDSKQIEINGLRFLIDAKQADNVRMAALQLTGESQKLEDCEFLQAGILDKSKQLMKSLVTESRGGSPATLDLRECRFFGFASPADLVHESGDKPDRLVLAGTPQGQQAIERHGPVALDLDNCAFGPHSSVITLEGKDTRKANVSLWHCTMLLGARSCAFDVKNPVTFEVSASLFSRPVADETMPDGPDGGAVLIRQMRGAGEIVYHGRDNRYHKLQAYLEGDQTIAELGDFVPMGDKTSRQLDSSPWADDPLAKWARPSKTEKDSTVEPPGLYVQFGGPDSPMVSREAANQNELLLLSPFKVGARLLDLRLATTPAHLVGVERVGIYEFLKEFRKGLDVEVKTPLVRTLTVVPGKDDSKNRIYSTLDAAILAARAGDTILIEANGEVLVRPIRLKEDASVELTIRPKTGFHPVLTIGETKETDPALFRLGDGKLSLEGLSFLLKPIDEHNAQTIVSVLGGGNCTFKDCLLTLDQNGKKAVLAAATIGDAAPTMMMEGKPDRGQAVLSFENCFVRGHGDLIWARQNRPFDLHAKNLLAALTGHFVNLAATSTTPADKQVNLELTRVTTYLGGHLLRLNAGKDLKSLLTVQVKPEKCLFLSPPNGKALVHLDGPDTSKEKLREKLLWMAGMNGYGTFASMFFDQQSMNGEASVTSMDGTEWKSFTGEDKSEMGVALANGPASDASYPQLTPDRFQPKKSTLGADTTTLQQLLPPPAEPRDEPD